MKIRVAILEKDIRYLGKIISTFNAHYSSKLEVFGFSDEAIAMEEVAKTNVDILLIPDSMISVLQGFTGKTVPVLLVEGHDVLEIGGYETICKYQKIDGIYKRILSVYSEHTEYEFINDVADGGCRMIAFANIAGGVGNTTVALAYAMRLASLKKKVLYIDFHAYSNVSIYLSDDVSASLSTVLYAIKSKKKNVKLSIESAISRDASGVEFLKETETALDLLEMTDEEAELIVDESCKLELYDYVILDIPFGLYGYSFNLIKKAHKIIWVSNGSVPVNSKLLRAYQAVTIWDEQRKTTLSARIAVVYNAFSSKTGKVIDNQELKSLGGIPKFANATERQIVEQIKDIEVVKKMAEGV